MGMGHDAECGILLRNRQLQDLEAEKDYKAWLEQQWSRESDKKGLRTEEERKSFLQSCCDAEAKRAQRMGQGSWQLAYKQHLTTETSGTPPVCHSHCLQLARH